MKRLVLAAFWLFYALTAGAEAVLRLDTTIKLRLDHPNFGGFSSLAVAQDGMSFMATSDRGYILRGDIQRQDGRMVGTANLALSPILDTKGRPLDGYNIDAEGLAVSASGEIFMSFEANHRIMRQTGPEALPEFVPKHPEFRSLINNSGLEALAIDPDGVLYAIPERSGAHERPYPVYRLQQGEWNRTWEIERRGEYLVSGADVFEKQLYVLERDLAGIRGFSSRIRRFGIGARLGAEEVLITSGYGRFDNLEGISMWKTPDGETRALMISDDNFKFYQITQLVEMVLESQP